MYLQQLNYLSIIVRILLAAIIGCLVMMTNQYVFNLYQSGDPARMGAQVISGIGFSMPFYGNAQRKRSPWPICIR